MRAWCRGNPRRATAPNAPSRPRVARGSRRARRRERPVRGKSEGSERRPRDHRLTRCHGEDRLGTCVGPTLWGTLSGALRKSTGGREVPGGGRRKLRPDAVPRRSALGDDRGPDPRGSGSVASQTTPSLSLVSNSEPCERPHPGRSQNRGPISSKTPQEIRLRSIKLRSHKGSPNSERSARPNPAASVWGAPPSDFGLVSPARCWALFRETPPDQVLAARTAETATQVEEAMRVRVRGD